MSRKMLKVLILGAMVVSALASATSASAAVWRSNGTAPPGTPFTATAAASKLTISGASAGINCATTSATGWLYGPSGTVGVDKVADITLFFSNCRAGGFNATVSCPTHSVSLWALSYAAPVLSGEIRANTDPICTVTVASISGCTIDVGPTGGIGSVVARATYNNTTSRLTVSNTGQALTATWRSCGTLFGPVSGSGAALFTDSTGASLVYTVTSAFKPVVTI
jgi:hypothetical protein